MPSTGMMIAARSLLCCCGPCWYEATLCAGSGDEPDPVYVPCNQISAATVFRFESGCYEVDPATSTKVTELPGGAVEATAALTFEDCDACLCDECPNFGTPPSCSAGKCPSTFSVTFAGVRWSQAASGNDCIWELDKTVVVTFGAVSKTIDGISIGCAWEGTATFELIQDNPFGDCAASLGDFDVDVILACYATPGGDPKYAVFIQNAAVIGNARWIEIPVDCDCPETGEYDDDFIDNTGALGITAQGTVTVA